MGLIARQQGIRIDTQDYFNNWCNLVRNALRTPSDEVIEGTGNNGYSPIYGHGWSEAEIGNITENVFRGLRNMTNRDGRQFSPYQAANNLVAKADWTQRVLVQLGRKNMAITGHETEAEKTLDDIWLSQRRMTAAQAADELIALKIAVQDKEAAKREWKANVLEILDRSKASYEGREHDLELWLETVYSDEIETDEMDAAKMLIDEGIAVVSKLDERASRRFDTQADRDKAKDATYAETESGKTVRVETSDEIKTAADRDKTALRREADQILKKAKTSTKTDAEKKFEADLKPMGEALRNSKTEDEITANSIAIYEFMKNAWKENVIDDKRFNSLSKELERIVGDLMIKLEA